MVRLLDFNSKLVLAAGRNAGSRAEATITVATITHRAAARNTPRKSDKLIRTAPNAGPTAQAIDQVARIMAVPLSAVSVPTRSRYPFANAKSCGKTARLVPSGKTAIKRR